MKKFSIMVIVAVMLFSLIACSAPATTSPEPEKPAAESEVSQPSTSDAKKTLTVAINRDPATFYPYYQLAGWGRALYTPVFEALFMYDENTEPEPILVDSYTIDDDEKGIVLNLKKGVLFHDGSEMKANDVMFSMQMLLESTWKSNARDVNMTESKVIDDYTVHFRYDTVPGPLLYQLVNVYVLSEKYQTSVNKDDWTFKCIGTGPYMWTENYSVGSEYHLAKFEGHREPRAFDEIVIRVVPESSVQTIELETGNVDLAMGLSLADVKRFEDDANDGFDVTWGPAIGSAAIMVSTWDAPYDVVEVRQALAVYSDLAKVPQNIYAYGIPAWAPAPEVHTYNIEKAKELLAAAGYADGVTLDLYVLNTTAFTQTAEVLLASAARAGITLNVIPTEQAAFQSLMGSKKSGLWLQTYYTNGDPYIMLSAYANGVHNERMNLGVDEKFLDMEATVQKAFQILDPKARALEYQNAMNISYDRGYTIPIMDTADVGVHVEGLKGFWMGGPAYHYEDAYWGD